MSEDRNYLEELRSVASIPSFWVFLREEGIQVEYKGFKKLINWEEFKQMRFDPFPSIEKQLRELAAISRRY